MAHRVGYVKVIIVEQLLLVVQDVFRGVELAHGVFALCKILAPIVKQAVQRPSVLVKVVGELALVVVEVEAVVLVSVRIVIVFGALLVTVRRFDTNEFSWDVGRGRARRHHTR